MLMFWLVHVAVAKVPGKRNCTIWRTRRTWPCTACTCTKLRLDHRFILSINYHIIVGLTC